MFANTGSQNLSTEKILIGKFSSKTYEPFMYLTVPVPNPTTRIIKVFCLLPKSSLTIRLALEIDREASVLTLIEALKEQLNSEGHEHGDDLRLYELQNNTIKREHRAADPIAFISSNPDYELLLTEPRDLTKKEKKSKH